MPESIRAIFSALSPVDWIIVIVYLLLSLGIGVYFTKRASKSMADYFVSGRNLPWWIIGTSMVATTFAVILCIGIAFFYTMMSGLWGVALTDFFQYLVALIGTTVFAYVVVNSPVVGGFDGFLEKINGVQSHLSFFMTPSSGVPVSKGFWSSSFFVFLVYVTVIWWSSHNSDGGGYFIQRMCAAKNERHAV